ncbi:MAG: hypothetical protein AABW49_01640 [Nanoarchaeota archaeon]
MKLSFIYSPAYDNMLTSMALQEFSNAQIVEVKQYISDLEVFWENEEKRIIKEIEKVSGLNFQKKIDCYVIKNMQFTAFSMPLTIKMDPKFSRVRAVLIHELIHFLLSSHRSTKTLIHKLNARYPAKDHEFKSHLPVYLIQKKVLENLFGEESIKKDMKGQVDNDVQIEANKLYKNFNKNILRFFK